MAITISAVILDLCLRKTRAGSEIKDFSKVVCFFIIKNTMLPYVCSIIGTFRLDYEYEIEYECDFSILVFRLHIIMSHTHFIP